MAEQLEVRATILSHARATTMQRRSTTVHVIIAASCGLLLLLVSSGLHRRRHRDPPDGDSRHLAAMPRAGRPAHRRAPPPRFIVAPRPPDLRTAFEEEPRDPLWASAREQFLKGAIEAELDGVRADSPLQSVECRSATCKLVFLGASLEDARRTSVAAQHPAAGNAIAPGNPYEEDGKVLVPVFVAYDAANRDHAVWARAHEKMRQRDLARPLPRP